MHVAADLNDADTPFSESESDKFVNIPGILITFIVAFLFEQRPARTIYLQ